MSLEGFPSKTENATFGSGDETVTVTSFEEYLALIKDHPPDKNDTPVEEKVEKSHRISKELRAKIANELNTQEFKELLENRLIDDLGYFSLDVKGFDDDYIKNIEDGYFVSHFIVYGEDGEVTGHHYYRERKDLPEDKILLGTTIQKKYRELNASKLELVEQAKEQTLMVKVKTGEIAYFGEMTTDQYIKMIKNGLPNGYVAAKLMVFDEQHNPIYNRLKLYMKIK